MAEITIGTTADVSVTILAEVANAVWRTAAYDRVELEVLPTPESYADWCRVQNVHLCHSVLARDAAGAIIGLAILARRGERGWCADFGIVPEWRGQGVGHRLMQAFIEQARLAGVRSVTLEVWGENHPARRIYERAGYDATRELIALRAEAATPVAGGGEEVAVRVRRSDLSVLPHWFGQEDAQGIPIWECQLPSLLVASDTRILVSVRNGRERALLVYRPPDSFGRIVLLRMGLATDAEVTDVRALLRAAAVDTPGAYFLDGAELEGSAAHRILVALAFRELGRSLEMARSL